MAWNIACRTSRLAKIGLRMLTSNEVDALVEKIKVETDPAKRKALVVEFQKIATLEAPNLPLVELESITVASTKVQNHSNDPNYLAATWHDIWLAS